MVGGVWIEFFCFWLVSWEVVAALGGGEGEGEAGTQRSHSPTLPFLCLLGTRDDGITYSCTFPSHFLS